MSGGQKRIFITHLTEVASSDVENVGTLRWEDGKCYKWVKLLNTTATVAGVAGDAVSYSVDAGYSNHWVVSDVTDSNDTTNPTGAGLLCGTVAGVAGTTYYCWIQIKGPATANQALGGSAADGDQLCASATDKVLRKQLYSGTTPSIAALGARVAVALDASAKIIACDFPF